MPNLRREHQEALDAFTFSLGKRITALREGQKMNISELARLVELEPGRVLEVECGRPIPLWTIKKFSDALCVPVDVLLFGESHQLPPMVEISRPVRDVAIRIDNMTPGHRRHLLHYLDIILKNYEQ